MTLLKTQDPDRALLRKGREVERLSLSLHYHPWRFSVAGQHCEEVKVQIEAAVSRYVDTRSGHVAKQPYSVLVMDVSCGASVEQRQDARDFKQAVLRSLTEAYNLSEKHINLPAESYLKQKIEHGGFAPTSIQYFLGGGKCPRGCGGMLFPDTDDRQRCVICGRYSE